MKKISVRIKEQRKKLGITMRELAKRIDLSASFLSQIENGKSTPSLQTLTKIANELHTTIGHLIGETEQQVKNAPIVRVFERKRIKEIAQGVELQYLTSLNMSNTMESCIHAIDKKTEYGNPPFQHYGQEFVLIMEGEIVIILNDIRYSLSEGDSIYFNSNLPHSFINESENECKFLCVSSPPRLVEEKMQIT